MVDSNKSIQTDLWVVILSEDSVKIRLRVGKPLLSLRIVVSEGIPHLNVRVVFAFSARSTVGFVFTNSSCP